MDGSSETKRSRVFRWYGAMAILFTLSHAVIIPLFQLRFETRGLHVWLHFLDIELLKHNLIESIFYLHIQPPLFNLFTGIVLKLFPTHFETVLYILYLGLGLTQYLLCFTLLRCFKIHQPLAFGLCTLFMLSPSFISFEHTYFYTMPCTVLLTLSAVTLHQYLASRNPWTLAACFGAIAVLCATRSLFHLFFLLLVVGATAKAATGNRRQVLLVALLPVLFLSSLYVKNYVLFGKFNLSTLMGRNLWVIAVANMNWEERKRLVEAGELSEFSLIGRWNDIRQYPAEYQRVEGFEGVEALHQLSKSNGAHNFNHFGQIAVSDRYMADSLYALRHYPKAFFSTLRFAWFEYLKTHYGNNWNIQQLRPLIRLYNALVYFPVPFDLSSRSKLVAFTHNPPYLGLLVGLPFLYGYGLVLLWRGRTGTGPLDRHSRITLLYLCGCIFFVFVVGTTFDLRDTNRYRFMTDPMYLTILGLFIQFAVVPKWKRRFRRESPKVSEGPANAESN